MFTIPQIEIAHSKVKSGKEFPNFIKEIKEMGVMAFETWVIDSHTIYFGKNNFQISSPTKYDTLEISNVSDKEKFENYLKSHQKGETDYFAFCRHCAETGIEKWRVDLKKMICVYYDKSKNEITVEMVPAV